MTREELLALVAFKHKSIPLGADVATQEYNDTWNMGGAQENARLKPLLTALIEDREALREALAWCLKSMQPPFEWEPFVKANEALAASDARLARVKG